MDKNLCDELEHLLAGSDPQSDLGGVRSLLRARLIASVAEGLEAAAGAGRRGEPAAGGPASIAAFLDDGLTQPERDTIVAALTRDASSCAEVSSAAALLDEIDAELPAVPPTILARAVATFAPANPLGQEKVLGRPRRTVWWRVGWASAAALVLIAGPVAWLILDEKPNQLSAPDDKLEARSIAPHKKRSCGDSAEPTVSDPRSREEIMKANEREAAQSPGARPSDPRSSDPRSSDPRSSDPCPPKAPSGSADTPKGPRAARPDGVR